MDVEFTKAEANGNDFLLVEAEAVAKPARTEFARTACARHRGIGADGVEFVRWRQRDGFDLELYNADGSESEISGNGTRCAVAWAAERHGWREMAIGTVAGEKRARVLAYAGDVVRVEMAMGQPEEISDEAIEAEGRRLAVTILSMGNPQCCVLVEDFPADWRRLGRALEAHPRFPHRTNVEWVRVSGPRAIEIRIFERGVGVTESSGTGSCAAAVTALRTGRVRSPVEVTAPGGTQQVAWAGAGSEVRLRGPARLIAAGKLRMPGSRVR